MVVAQGENMVVVQCGTATGGGGGLMDMYIHYCTCVIQNHTTYVQNTCTHKYMYNM